MKVDLPRRVGVGAVIVIAVLWILTGVLTRDDSIGQRALEPQPMLVETRALTAEEIERVLILQGQVEPGLSVSVRARTAGQVNRWAVNSGETVQQGQLLLELSIDDREARRREALARVKRMESEYDATQRLLNQNSISQTEAAAREAELAAARANLEAIELDISNTRIMAPIDGVLNHHAVERGEFVTIGNTVARVINNDPLLAVVQVPQHQISRVARDLPATVRFVDGRETEGRVTYVAPTADPATRTFRVEVTVSNPDSALPSGISATVEIPTDLVMAHKLSPAVLSLNESGQIGIKTVDNRSVVRFHPVEIVRTDVDGVWVSGLPARVRVITTGQAFVLQGDKVRFDRDAS